MNPARGVRLLMAIDSLSPGGTERVFADMVTHLHARGYEMEVVLTHGTTMAFELPADVRVVKLDTGASAPGETSTFLRSARTLGRAIRGFADRVREWNPDLVLTFQPHTNMIGLMARAWFRFAQPILCSDHCMLRIEIPYRPFPWLRTVLTRRFYPRAAKHVSVSSDARRELIEYFGVPANTIVTIPNGVDLESVRRLAAEPIANDELARLGKGLRIIAAGRLSAAKAFDVLLPAVSRLRAKEWQLLLVGDGEDRGSLQALARELGIADRTHFLGWQKNPFQWMAQADVYVLSSRWETMPNVVLEAMAVGLPVIATDCTSAIAEMLEDSRDGRIIPRENAEALTAAIDDFLGDAELRQRMAASALERANAFDLRKTIDRYGALIQDMAGTALDDLIEQADVVSFDVFDTLLMRRHYIPADIFSEVGFRFRRIFAEFLARTLSRGEVTLEQIYRLLPGTPEKELLAEKRSLFANPAARAIYERAVARGKRIVATSDMYLPKSMIEELLHANGYEKIERVYVSCENGLTKRRGDLFRHIAKELGVPPERILHIGDSEAADIRPAHARGVRAHHLRSPRARFESGNYVPSNVIRALRSTRRASHSLILGLMRDALLDCKDPNYCLGFAIGGPTLHTGGDIRALSTDASFSKGAHDFSERLKSLQQLGYQVELTPRDAKRIVDAYRK